MNRMETERMYAYFLCSIPMIGGVRAAATARRAVGSPQVGHTEAGVTGWRECVSESIAEYMDRQKKEDAWRQEYEHSLQRNRSIWCFPGKKDFRKSY